MKLKLERIKIDVLPELYHIPVACGIHMYETLGLSHWYPFMSMPLFIKSCLGKNNYQVLLDGQPVGLFNLTPKSRSYYHSGLWRNAKVNAFYFGNFAILPQHQGKGIGKWSMAQVDRITQEVGYSAVRFDALAAHTRLVEFYEKLGYEKRGTVEGAKGDLMCFEKVFSLR